MRALSMLTNLLKAILPHGLVVMRQRAREERARVEVEAAKAAYHAGRRERIAAVEGDSGARKTLAGDDYEKVVSFLIQRGLPENHVREGSVPPASLEFVRDHVIARLEGARPLRALHVGNFVGVSLAFFTAALVRRNPQSLMVSVDPNLTHRGIRNPQSHVLALLSACGLQSNSLVLAGYSGKKSISNDATVFEGYDPAKEFANEAAGEETLHNLGQLYPGTFDLIFLDGNHEAAYLLNEMKQVLPLLRPGGYVVLDDVDASWAEIRDVFQRITEFGLEPVEANGRVGIARSRTAAKSNS